MGRAAVPEEGRVAPAAATLSGRTVVVDFDGVLHSYRSGWTGHLPLDPPEPGAGEFVDWLAARGAKVVVVSTRARTRRGERAIRRWLKEYGFPALEVTHHKVPAAAYVDDRAVPYSSGGGWEECQLSVARLARTQGAFATRQPSPP